MPFFSIILPTYNCEKTINFCLDSILNQTFLDFEVLIMDGLSSDSTLEKLKSYNDPRLIIYSEPDKGIYDAMNKGIKKAKGAWLYFIGSDDSFYDCDVLVDLYNEINNSKLDVIYGNAFMMKSGLINDGEFDFKKIQTHPICHQAIFYSRKIFNDFGLYDQKYKIAADVDMNLKWFFSNKHQYKYINRIVAKYAETGISSKFIDESFYNDLPAKLIYLGYRNLGIVKLKELTLIAYKNNKIQRSFIKSYLYKSFFFILRVVDILRRRIFNIIF